MIFIKPNLLRKLNLRLDHNHSGEHGDYTWKVIDWHENEKYCYDYKVQFMWKINGRSVGTHMFYGVNADGKLLKASVDYVIHHSISHGKRPPPMHLMQSLQHR